MKKQFSFDYLYSLLSTRAFRQALLVGGTFILLIAASALGYWGYCSYRSNQERLAQKSFSQAVDAFNATAQSSKEQEWESVLNLLNAGYDQYKHTSLAPFFLSYKVQVLLHQCKKEEAVKVLEQMLGQISDPTMHSLFGIKQALLLLDLDGKESEEQGVQALQKLATDTHNLMRDMAQYHLGDYYWTHSDMDQAKQVWEELIESQWQSQVPSPWARLAQETLKSVS